MRKKSIGLMGGTGLLLLPGLERTQEQVVETPYGPPSAPLSMGHWQGIEVVFLPRHGQKHTLAPHEINYRANVWAMHHVGVRDVVAVNAVGGITAAMQTGAIAVPDQLVDYTWGRTSTYFESVRQVKHIDFTNPFTESLRRSLVQAGKEANLSLVSTGTYGVTQGPRLETVAEIRRLERDGCDLVGMTAMPEAALAREMELSYAMLALVVNPAAGKAVGEITLEAIHEVIAAGMQDVLRVLTVFLKNYSVITKASI